MYCHASPSNRSRMIFVAMVAAIPAMFACGGGGGGGADTKAAADAAPPCPIPSDSILGGALEYFISTRNPPPHRFLIPLGTDSVVPDGAQYVLNALGRASYIWPSDPALQKQQIDNMRAKGGFVTVALFYHKATELPQGRRAFHFSGIYTDRANDGTRIDRTSVYFNCQSPEGSRYSLTNDVAAPAGQQPPPAAAAGSGGDD